MIVEEVELTQAPVGFVATRRGRPRNAQGWGGGSEQDSRVGGGALVFGRIEQGLLLGGVVLVVDDLAICGRERGQKARVGLWRPWIEAVERDAPGIRGCGGDGHRRK